MAAHLSNGFLTVFLKLDECINHIVLQLANKLLSWVSEWEDIVQFYKLVDADILVARRGNSRVRLVKFSLAIELHLFIEEERLAACEHDLIIFVFGVGLRPLVALGGVRVVRVLRVPILEVIILILIGEAAEPVSFFLLLFLLENFNFKAGKSNLDLACSATDDFLADDTVVDLAEELDVLVEVDVGCPAVSHSEQHLLEHDEAHALLASGVVDPLLRHLAANLLLTIQREEDFVHAFE